MMLISQRLILPALFSVSCGGTLLYYLLYRKKNNPQQLDATKSKYSSTKLVYKLIMHEICGNTGSFIKELQDQTETEFSLEVHTSDEKYYVCTIRGNKKNVDLAMDMLSYVVESQQSKVEDEFIYVPHNAFTRIMRGDGEILEEIQARYKVDITLVNDSEPFEFKITGIMEQIREARRQIEEIIEEVRLMQAKEQWNCSILQNNMLHDTNLIDTNIFHKLPINHPIEVYICKINTPSEFWFQLACNNELDNLANMMKHHTYEPLEKSEIYPGELVIVKVDNECYRAEIIKILEDDQCYVYYLDVGQCHVVLETCIFNLPSPMLIIPSQAVQCSLADVIPKDDQWCNEACEKFSELTLMHKRKPLIARVRSYEDRFNIYGTACPMKLTVSSVDLYNKNDDENINIGQALIDFGFAQSGKDNQIETNSTSYELPVSSISTSSVSNNYVNRTGRNFMPAGYESDEDESCSDYDELF